MGSVAKAGYFGARDPEEKQSQKRNKQSVLAERAWEVSLGRYGANLEKQAGKAHSDSSGFTAFTRRPLGH
ncbi:hypothetical protein PG996_002131 [Apiospora saccharicola]|uniref:Uncharacterized protein n=1 Tax=Apiospora saccharicola TaxID=335842 RepID=A0ABR1WIL8_9PEZI